MATKPVEVKVVTLVSNKWWDSVQEDLSDAIIDIDKLRETVKHMSKWMLIVDLLDTQYIDGKLEKIRRLLENIQTPL